MRAVLGILVFMMVWIFGCYIADYVIQFESRAYTMSWGYAAGIVAVGLAKLAERRG